MKEVRRWKCNYCDYVYSPLRGEPNRGIPAGTEFEDLPDDYMCPVCGAQGKGKVGKWGFTLFKPTRWRCKICGYVYDQKRGEPASGIKPGTRFEDLPDDYMCPVCGQDPRLSAHYGKVGKGQFEAIDY